MTDATNRSFLLTGATTPLGCAVAEALQQAPNFGALVCVHGLDEPLPSDPPAHVRHLRADLTRYRSLRDLLFCERVRGVDTIVHLPPHLDPLVHGERALVLNVESTRHLLALAEEHPTVSRFVLRSFADVYRIDSDEPVLIDEDHPLDISLSAAEVARSRVEADLAVCSKIGSSRLQIAVLRCAEILAPHVGSQLHDYLGSRLCLRALGYDPMVNLLSLSDAARAIVLAASSNATGVFNIPGCDTLPLSELIHRSGRFGLALPGPLLAPLYGLRAVVTSRRFRYGSDRKRFHYGTVLDGRKASRALGYVPESRLAFEQASELTTA